MRWWIAISLIFLLALVPIASANIDQFNITVCPSTPYYVGFVYGAPVYLTAYSFNSSIDIAHNNWSIYGSNDGQLYYEFENQSMIDFTHDTVQIFNLSCGYVYFRYYIIVFEGGFTHCPLVTIQFFTQGFPPFPASKIGDVSTLSANTILVAVSCGLVFFTIILGALWKKRRKKQRDTKTRTRVLS
jgi:hypothetical protein